MVRAYIFIYNMLTWCLKRFPNNVSPRLPRSLHEMMVCVPICVHHVLPVHAAAGKMRSGRKRGWKRDTFERSNALLEAANTSCYFQSKQRNPLIKSSVSRFTRCHNKPSPNPRFIFTILSVTSLRLFALVLKAAKTELSGLRKWKRRQVGFVYFRLFPNLTIIGSFNSINSSC